VTAVRAFLLGLLPFAAFLGGLVLSTQRFRARDPLGGLMWGEGGFLAMLVLAILLGGRADERDGV
jgi:hypothetical protein